jgi:hypothetical protein
VKAGPVDDDGWTLLASNAAAAAKLRQYLPRLSAELLRRGLKPTTVKVRIVTDSNR